MHPKNPYTADLETAEHRLSQVPHDTRNLIDAVEHLRGIEAEGAIPLILTLSRHRGESRDRGTIFCILRDDVDAVALKANAVLAKVLPTPEYQAALAEVKPLADEVARLTAAAKEWDHNERLRLAAAREAREEALAAAIAAATAKVDAKHPELAAAG
jgi:hypothetical protein